MREQPERDEREEGIYNIIKKKIIIESNKHRNANMCRNSRATKKENKHHSLQ
jgi:hypothetical protein